MYYVYVLCAIYYCKIITRLDAPSHERKIYVLHDFTYMKLISKLIYSHPML